MRTKGTTVLFTEDDGTVGEDHTIDNYVVVVDGTAYVSDVVVRFETDGTYTHFLTIRGCNGIPKPDQES